jgi:hypothetical protein
MLILALRGVDELDEHELAEQLRAAGGHLRLVVVVRCLNSAIGRNAIAAARLAVWYIAEMVALHGQDVDVREAEDDDEGDTEVVFDVKVTDIPGLVPKICWMAPAFDPETEDDGTAWFDFGCEIEGWLEDRGNASTLFPKLKADYEADAEDLNLSSDDDDDTNGDC